MLLTGATLLSCNHEKDRERVVHAQCQQVPAPGVCMGAISKYYHNPKTGCGEQFTWGGCGGVVPFQTLQKCLDCGCEANLPSCPGRNAA
ncbi:hypothetical protein GCM10027048_29460 [Hymenobacter coalescens]